MLLGKGQPRLFAIEQAGAIVIVDAGHLKDTGIAQEGAGALAVAGAELMDVLQDRPSARWKLTRQISRRAVLSTSCHSAPGKRAARGLSFDPYQADTSTAKNHA